MTPERLAELKAIAEEREFPADMVAMLREVVAHAEQLQTVLDASDNYTAFQRLKAERDKLLAFKDYVHSRLDDAGVPADPESPHKAEGCRIGGRLDIVLAAFTEVEHLRAVVERDADEEPHLSQPALIGGIACWLEKSGGVKEMNPRQMNAVIKAANLIMAELGKPSVLATAGMGLQKWLASDDTGRSSRYMASALAPAIGDYAPHNMRDYELADAHPHDPDDFGRCVRLLDAVPELRPHIPLLREHGKVWSALAAEWDTLEAWYREDLPTGKSERLYMRICELKASTPQSDGGKDADSYKLNPGGHHA